MKYYGGLLLVLYSFMMAFGFDAFSDDDRGRLPANTRNGPSGILGWHTGYLGGK